MRKSYHINDPRLREIRSAYFLKVTIPLDGHEGRFDVIDLEPNRLFTDRIDVTFREHIDETKKVKVVNEGRWWVPKEDVPRFTSGLLTYKREDCMPKQDDRTVTPTVAVDLYEEVDVENCQLCCDANGKMTITVEVWSNDKMIRLREKYGLMGDVIFLIKDGNHTFYARFDYEVPASTGFTAWRFNVIGQPGFVFTEPLLASPKNGSFTQLHRARMNKVKKI